MCPCVCPAVCGCAFLCVNALAGLLKVTMEPQNCDCASAEKKARVTEKERGREKGTMLLAEGRR